MLSIRMKSDELIRWSIGHKFPSPILMQEVFEIELSGDELELVRNKFSFVYNYPRLPSLRLFGAQAKTVVANLPAILDMKPVKQTPATDD